LLELLSTRNLSELAGGGLFKTHGYGFAFGNDDTSFIPWTQALTLLHEAGEIDKYFSSGQGYDYKIGAAGLQQLEGECDSGDDGANGFYAMEFFGLTLLCGIPMVIALMQVIQCSSYIYMKDEQKSRFKIENITNLLVRHHR
jgi:hypothetical protein